MVDFGQDEGGEGGNLRGRGAVFGENRSTIGDARAE